ncbi:MAG TPA: enolase C-terminal domain-like protein [Chloroflexota bacterium]|nr:enolase C-terminal domain-like protein [Chloroflexota bacterium]
MSKLKITDVRVICTQPERVRLIVVKVLTSEPGLYGVGCATFTQRADAVVTAIEKYLRPFVIGRDPDDIEDIFQAAYVSSYWRSGPVLNNALSGIDQALWDIKGKRANMPVYQLLGGKCRQFVPVYTHASGRDFAEVEENVRKYQEQGFRYIRCQVAVPGMSTYGSRPSGAGNSQVWEGSPYCRIVPKLFEHLRTRLGEEVELLHDIHERIPPIQAIALAKELEQYHLFFLEDPFSPEDIEYFRILRQQTAIPIAMGELFVNQSEYVPLVKDRLIDFMRVHISDIGGLSMARKLAAFCEFFGVRTAWHGPGDVSPVGHAANLALDLACPNFGIQELAQFSDAVKAVFPGCPEVRDGALWPIERPGLGVDVDEKEAAKFPFQESPLNGGWPEIRRLDGTVVRP